MDSTSAFYTDSEVINRKIDTTIINTDECKIDEIYEIQRCVKWIQDSKYHRVALQFPDDLMQDAVAVTQRLETSLPAEYNIFILGDTSYGSCCVDEVAAQHYNADAIIHYGRSCLSEPVKMPALFVYGRLPLDVTHCMDQLSVVLPGQLHAVVLLYDTIYTYCCDEIAQKLKQKYNNVVMSRLVPGGLVDNITQDSNSSNHCDRNGDRTRHISKCGRTFLLPSNVESSDCTMLYIGGESLTLTNLMYNFPSCEFYSYNPTTSVARRENLNVNKMLMKRYYLIEKAKDARIVGILIGTLGVANYLDILNRLKTLIKKAGKKSYVFIVGKVNVAKLANFMEIDVFVLIACAENTLLDSSEYYKPVLTPFEMEIACNPDREWTGEYPTNFTELLQGGNYYQELPDTIVSDETDISLVTGKIRSLGQGNQEVTTESAVVLRSDTMTVATQADSAGEFLEMRSWQGLEQKLGETPVTMAIEGQSGIAMGYGDEPTMNQK